MLVVGREPSRASAEPWSDHRGGAYSVGSTGSGLTRSLNVHARPWSWGRHPHHDGGYGRVLEYAQE
jgi:hypothetical protein